MDKQQQVLEMAKDICRVKLNCNDVCNPISACNAFKYAKRAVEAGYCKQGEGEWITPTTIGGRAFNIPHCSVCGGVPCGVDENTRYCPECGAHMSRGKTDE